MIEKFNNHYSFTTPASVHDEESLTALELAGRQGAKINEVIDDQNNLRNETENHLTAQDDTIEMRLSNQDKNIDNHKKVVIPDTVKNEFNNNVNNGTFDEMIDQYAGNLTARVNNILGKVVEGSISSMDAEVIDGRVGSDNTVYSTIGNAIRKQTIVNDTPIKDVICKKGINLVNPYTLTLTENAYLDFTGNILTSFGAHYGCTSKIYVDEGKTYTIGYVPDYNGLTLPWNEATCGVVFYDMSGNVIATTKTQTFTTPANTHFIRMNIYTGGGNGMNRYNLCQCLMLVEGESLPTTFSVYNSVMLNEEVETLKSSFDEIKSHFINTTINLYNPALQTPDTVSDSYLAGANPTTDAGINKSYDSTNFIEVEEYTQYTLGLVPAYSGNIKPWTEASFGVLFYDNNKNYLKATANNTFITPVTCKYIKFNFSVFAGITLECLNTRCMLVKGDTLPAEYLSYNTQDNTVSDNIFYHLENDSLIVNSRYNGELDMSIGLKKKGGNNIFDFNSAGFIANNSPNVSNNLTPDIVIFNGTGDWHAPFQVMALNNADGDQPEKSSYFTGGNHCYNNTGTGGTPTGRTDTVKVYVDNRLITNGSGTCNKIRIEWDNYVQGNNTTKEDGSGREILKENHIMSFDGERWESYIELIPLEDIKMQLWYGLQCFGFDSPNATVRYIGGSNRGVYHGGSSSKSGNLHTNEIGVWVDNINAIMGIDTSFDLGRREYTSGDDGMFVSGAKAYCNIIRNKTMTANEIYTLKGYYIFRAI